MTDQTPTQGLEPSEASSVIFTPGTKLREIERIVILETLKQKSFNRTHTARALGIGIRTLQRKLIILTGTYCLISQKGNIVEHFIVH